jgi:chromosome segregation ATPase
MMSKGSSSCKTQKMRGGKMNMKGMKEMQERLTQQLSKMKDKLGSLNRQQKGIRNENEGLNEEIARMAALQEAIRNELQKYQERMIEEGQKDGGNVNKAIEEMEQIEKDIINRNIKQETLNRQQRILTRMLESEKAEEMREREEKRESEETKIQKISNPKESSTYKKHRQGENEILIMEEIQVREYYKNIIDNYMIKINK